MKKLALISLLATGLLLTGCASRETVMSTWVGHSIDDATVPRQHHVYQIA
jgi:hypothetical protein